MTTQDIEELERGYTESKIQHTCVVWFRSAFPDKAGLLFAVPNGGWRGARSGAQMVYEGQVRGVADLILLDNSGGRGALCVEMKVPKRRGSSAGRQSEHQKRWQELVESHGARYTVCHGIEEFVRAVCAFLGRDPSPHIEEVLNKYPLYR